MEVENVVMFRGDAKIFELKLGDLIVGFGATEGEDAGAVLDGGDVVDGGAWRGHGCTELK